MLHQVRKIPDRLRVGCESYVAHDIREFVRSGMGAAEITYQGKGAERVRNACASWMRDHPEQSRGIHACVRQGSCYLVREDL